MLRNFAAGLSVALVFVACQRAPTTESPPAADAQAMLSAFAAQRIVVVPAGSVRADSLGWVAHLGGPRGAVRRLDSAIVTILEMRGLASRWVLPADLTRAYERNRAYAADPYQLVWDPVRSPRFKSGERYGEPLSSQLRTMVALQNDTRYVLLPIEVRFERASAASGRAMLRAALVDARTTEARWVGELKGETATDAATALARVAAKLADLFVAP